MTSALVETALDYRELGDYVPEMPLSPPATDSAPTPSNVAALRAWLRSIQAFQESSADEPWLFYEEIDAYLGPWGERGYPIGYGKKYCQRFFNDVRLRDDPMGRRWMEHTLLLLQQEIQRFALQRYVQGTLSSMSERELRRFALGSHSRAYVRAGFTQLILQRPAVVANVAYLVSSGAVRLDKNTTVGAGVESAIAKGIAARR